MEFFRAYQLDIMLILSGVCGTLAVLVLLTKSLTGRRRRELFFIEVSAMLLLIFDRYAYIYRIMRITALPGDRVNPRTKFTGHFEVTVRQHRHRPAACLIIQKLRV